MNFKFILLATLLSSMGATIHAQDTEEQSDTTSFRLERSLANDGLTFDPELAPFYHGVASGDPLQDRVVIWTRVTPLNAEEEIQVGWAVSTDPEFTDIVTQGLANTNEQKDYTVKVDVTGLEPATTYYYVFREESSLALSIVGRTRTAPSASEVDQLKFAVVSCANYQAGYYNAYKRISERPDLDAVLHLGDYIYEYGGGSGTYGYDGSRPDRFHIPDQEILDVADYRTRYSLYRLDPDLRAVHQQHPFICIWDDHESANDAYKNGAENHNAGEGSWSTRKEISKQVYFEWMPIRNQPDQRLYRTLNYGDLADLVMIDTRLEGRQQQISSAADTNQFRTMLGNQQKIWLAQQFQESDAQWKILVNQVIFSPLNVGFTSPLPTSLPLVTLAESIFVDIWDGYPKERKQILEFIRQQNIDNVVIVSGDFHSAFGFDVTDMPVRYPDPNRSNLPTVTSAYTPSTGQGSVAVEFVTPSISSDNFDENVGSLFSDLWEDQINQYTFYPTALDFANYNPHMKFADLDRHGYFVLDITPQAAQADWYFIDLLTPNSTFEERGKGLKADDGTNHLKNAPQESISKPNPPILAPERPLQLAGILPLNDTEKSKHKELSNVQLFHVYPNPVSPGGIFYVQFGLSERENIQIELRDMQGRVVEQYKDMTLEGGNYTDYFPIPRDLDSGIYMFELRSSSHRSVRKILVD